MREMVWKWLRDIAILDMYNYMNTNRDDIFSEYKDQYDDMSKTLEQIKIYIINKSESNTDIKRIVQRYDVQINELDRKIDGLNSTVKTLQDTIGSLQRQLNKVNNTPATNQYSNELKIQSLNSQITDLIKKVGNLEKKLDEKNFAYSTNGQIDKYIARITELEQTVSEQNKLINAQATRIEKLEKNFEKINPIIEQLIQKNETVIEQQTVAEEKPKEEQPKEVFDIDALPVFNRPEVSKQSLNIDDWFVPNLEKQYDIKKFDIANTNKLFLSGDISKIKIELQKALNTDNIVQFLQQSSLESKQTYLNIFERYKKHIQKFIDNVDIEEDDEDIWENITEDFFKIVQNDILSNFMIGIYRGTKSGNKLYEAFLNEVNKYLASCCIYTRYIHPDVKYKKDDLNDMVPLKKETSDIGKDDYIDEVERLPYYIDYLNEDREKEYFCYDGRFVIWKYEEKK